MAQDRTRASLRLLYNVGRELASSLDLKTVLGRVLILSTEYVGAERGTLIVLDDHQRPIEAATILNHELLPNTFMQLQGLVEQGLAGWVLRNKQAALLADTSLDDRWLRRPDDDVRRSGPKSAICLPLMVQANVTGILTIVHPQPGFFNSDHLALLQAISDQAGISVYNARLYASIQSVTRRYRELFEDSINPIFITDWGGQIIEGNRQASHVTGFTTEQLASRTVHDLHEVRRDLLGPDCANLRNGETIFYESILKTQAGKEIPVEVYANKVSLEDGGSIQWIVRDVSARKDLDALREDLAAMIYHDLRSPLSNIISSLDMLNAILPVEANPSLRSIFNIANRSTERMQRLISSLLDINRLEAGQPITNQKPVLVKDLADSAVAAVQPLLDGKQQTLEIDLPSGLPRVWVDEDMARRVLINIIENGIKYTPARSHLWLSFEEAGEWVRFNVRDSGPGIPSESRDKIFEKFVRLPNERVIKGLGIGLAFCRLAVRAHGGKIWVESEPGAGSTFSFTLPVVRES